MAITAFPLETSRAPVTLAALSELGSRGTNAMGPALGLESWVGWLADGGSAAGGASGVCAHVVRAPMCKSTAAAMSARMRRMRAGAGNIRFGESAKPTGQAVFHICMKLRIICRPPSVNTLSGWNCTPSMGSVLCRTPMITEAPSLAGVRAVIARSRGSEFSSTIRE